MFVEERKKKIMELLKLQNRATIIELTDLLDVSEATIRRDLQDLEQTGSIKRTHGGAMMNLPSNIEPTFNEKEITCLEEKKQIALFASKFIQDGDVIVIDSGTTTIQIMPLIIQKRITIITNSIAAAFILSSYENINLIVAGGQHRNVTKALVGSFANKMFSQLNANKAFLGANAFDVEFGASTPSFEEAETKRLMASCADEVFVLADHTKFNKRSLVSFADVSNIQYIVTDRKTPSSIARKLEQQGVHVIQ